MKNKRTSFTIITIVYALMLLASCKKAQQKQQQKVVYKEAINLSSKISKMLEHDSIFYATKIKDAEAKVPRLFFWYSKQECSTCAEHAFTEVYTAAKTHALFKNITVITPELKDKEIKNLNIRYDNIINFIIGKEAIWDTNYLKDINSLSLFFIINLESKVENAFVYKIYDTKLNTEYFEHLKNTY